MLPLSDLWNTEYEAKGFSGPPLPQVNNIKKKNGNVVNIVKIISTEKIIDLLFDFDIDKI